MRIFSCQEAAEYLGINYQTVARFCRTRIDFPATKIGNSWKIPEADLEEWVRTKARGKEHIKTNECS